MTPKIEDRILALEHATAFNLALSTFALAGQTETTDAAAARLRTLLVLATRSLSDTRDNPAFDEAMKDLIGRWEIILRNR